MGILPLALTGSATVRASRTSRRGRKVLTKSLRVRKALKSAKMEPALAPATTDQAAVVARRISTPPSVARETPTKERDGIEQAHHLDTDLLAAGLRRSIFEWMDDTHNLIEDDSVRWMADAICDRWIDRGDWSEAYSGGIPLAIGEDDNSGTVINAFAQVIFGRELVPETHTGWGRESLDYAQAYLVLREMAPEHLKSTVDNCTQLFFTALTEWVEHHSQEEGK